MRIIYIQKIIIIFSFVIGLYSNTLQSMGYDYAQLVLVNAVNVGAHMIIDVYFPNQLFSSLGLIKHPFSTYCLLGVGKTLYDMCLLHNKYAILTKTDHNNKTLT